MAHTLVADKLHAFGLQPVLRVIADGSPYVTDGQNYILDCASGVVEDPVETASKIRGIVGVVEHGLFLGMAELAVIASEEKVLEIRPEDRF
jgi:ribose 5-phosphate isomerase A